MTQLPSIFGSSATKRLKAAAGGGTSSSRLPPQHFSPYVDPLTGAYLQQDQLARTENEERYLDILSGLQGTRGRITGDLDQFGQSLRDDTNRRADLSYGDQISDLTSRGLGASTIRTSVKRANDRERNAELRRVEDLITDKKTGADERLSNALYAFMERRNDVQPNPQTLAQLSQGLGQSGMQYIDPQAMSPYLPPRQLGNVIRMPGGSRTGVSAGIPGGPNYGNYTREQVPRYMSPAIQASPYANTSYSPPSQSGGFDDPLTSATARYAGRQNSQLSPQGYGGVGATGYSPYGFPRYTVSQNRSPQWMYSPRNQTQQSSTPVSNPSFANPMLAAQNRELEQRNAAKAEFFRPKTKQWTVDSYYPGFGANLKKEMDGGQLGLAPAMGNIPYTNPVQQLNQLQAGALQSAPSYTQMPTGYPLGQPSVKPKQFTPKQQQQMLAQAATALMLPGFPNPYAALLK